MPYNKWCLLSPSATIYAHKQDIADIISNFTATIFIIQLGPNGHQFHAHESVLNRSSKFREEVHKAKSSKRATKQNILTLMAHDPVAFEQMLQYLYKDKFQLSKTKLTALDRIAEIHELMSLAKLYVLPGLQKQIVKLFSTSKILAKITPATFFDWAEDMYYEELDHENGPFKTFFARVAPSLMRCVDPSLMKDLCRMVNLGGGFAEELFRATHTVCFIVCCVVDTGTRLIRIGVARCCVCQEGGGGYGHGLRRYESFPTM